MTKRNPVVVVLLALVTFGIYALVWYIKTAREMRARGAEIPHGILIIIPIANLYWLWKWAAGVEKVTAGGMSGPVAFLLVALIAIVGIPVCQSKFNAVA